MDLDELSGPLKRYSNNPIRCSGCGDAFASRNGLFRHLRYHGCGGGVPQRARRLLILYGYVGTRFHGSQLNEAQEDHFPTVEGALLEAIKASQGPGAVAEICSRASRTDKGVHALANAVVVRITSEYHGKEEPLVESLSHHLPEDLTVLEAHELSDPEFNARFACQKREYWYYVPYEHLLPCQERELLERLKHEGLSSKDPLAREVWISGLPEATTEQELLDFLTNYSALEPDEIHFSHKDGSARVRLPDASSVLSLCWALDGADGPLDRCGARGPLLALPNSVMEVFQGVHQRLRACLKRLTGTHSFHNFSSGLSPSEPKSMRTVYRCRSGITSGFKDLLSGRAYAVLRFTGRDFLYHQIRAMAGLVCAVTSGVLADSYLDKALGPLSVEVPLAPAQHLVLAECSFKDGLYASPIGSTRREQDRLGGRRGLPGPKACWKETKEILEAIQKAEAFESFASKLKELGKRKSLTISSSSLAFTSDHYPK